MDRLNAATEKHTIKPLQRRKENKTQPLLEYQVVGIILNLATRTMVSMYVAYYFVLPLKLKFLFSF